MIRGLCKQWKQPFGYFLTGNSIPSSDFKCLLLEAIDLVTKAGFKIVCLICDQSPINQGLYRDLKISNDKPFFFP